MVPVKTPGGKPVIELPGLTPTSPVTEVEPVLVTADAPKTAKFCAVPIGGAACAHALLRGPMESNRTAAIKYEYEHERMFFTIVVFPFDPPIPLARLSPAIAENCAGISGVEGSK